MLLVFQQIGALASQGCPPDSGGAPADAAKVKELLPPMFDENKVIQTFKAAGFSCTSFDRDLGITCKAPKGVVPGYSQEVAIIIPPHFIPGDAPDLFMHVHGDASKPEGFDKYVAKYGFAKKLADSGRQSIMILPFSTGVGLSRHVDLKDTAKFQKFMGSLTANIVRAGLATKTAVPTHLTISAHSGGADAAASIVGQECSAKAQPCYGKLVEEVHLFDGTYDRNATTFARFALGSGGGKKILSVVSRNDSEGASGLAGLKSEYTRLSKTSDGGEGLSIPQAAESIESSVDEQTFIRITKAEHEEVVDKFMLEALTKRDKRALGF